MVLSLSGRQDYPSISKRTSSLFKQRKSTKQPHWVVCLKENFLTLWQLCNGITIIVLCISLRSCKGHQGLHLEDLSLEGEGAQCLQVRNLSKLLILLHDKGQEGYFYGKCTNGTTMRNGRLDIVRVHQGVLSSINHHHKEPDLLCLQGLSPGSQREPVIFLLTYAC